METCFISMLRLYMYHVSDDLVRLDLLLLGLGWTSGTSMQPPLDVPRLSTGICVVVKLVEGLGGEACRRAVCNVLRTPISYV